MLTFAHVIAQFCCMTVCQNIVMEDWGLSIKGLACELSF